ncbi:MAG: MarR family winged helix-turn-helix transcriptional regulator [Solirubrobacteraceae bacterium]
MPEAHFSGDANVVGAMALALGDRLRAATEEAAGLAGVLPAALVSLHEFAGGRPIEVLAGALRVTHSRAVRVVDQLQAEGLARRGSDPADRRAVRVELTATGRRRARRVAAARATVLDEALAGLSPDGRTALAGLAATVLGELAGSRLEARQICRLCDVHACGHDAGRCPVTNAVDAVEAAR